MSVSHVNWAQVSHWVDLSVLYILFCNFCDKIDNQVAISIFANVSAISDPKIINLSVICLKSDAKRSCIYNPGNEGFCFQKFKLPYGIVQQQQLMMWDSNFLCIVKIPQTVLARMA